MHDQPLTIRTATARDAAALARLAALDSRPSLTGHVLVAEQSGVPVAALALSSGAVATDPLSFTAGAVAALRSRRYQFLRQGGDVGPVASLLRRLPRPAVGS